jgi:hypothetical protein
MRGGDLKVGYGVAWEIALSLIEADYGNVTRRGFNIAIFTKILSMSLMVSARKIKLTGMSQQRANM